MITFLSGTQESGNPIPSRLQEHFRPPAPRPSLPEWRLVSCLNHISCPLDWNSQTGWMKSLVQGACFYTFVCPGMSFPPLMEVCSITSSPQERKPSVNEMRRPSQQQGRPLKGKQPNMQFFGPSDFVPELPHNVQVAPPPATILQGFDCFRTKHD